VKVNSFGYFAFARAHVSCVGVVGTQGVADEGEISIIDSQTDGRRGYYFSIRSTDYITRLLFLTSFHTSYKTLGQASSFSMSELKTFNLDSIFFNREIYI